VTVCTAAIAEKVFIIGASDRMLTAGDIEFEPDQAKIWVFSPSIAALIAGDMSIQAEIFKRVEKEVKKWILNDPSDWVKVRSVAELYCAQYRELRRERAEAEILYPLGLTLPTFLDQQANMHPDQVENIAEKLTEYDFPTLLETIFIGKDHDGPTGDHDQKLVYCQLYTTEKDRLSCLTTVGFAAIGIGKIHAESQFMFSGHWPLKSFHETLLLTYAAKKRAEVAPGVGKATDMFVIGPDVGHSTQIKDKHIAQLEKIYQKSRRGALRSTEAALKETQKFVELARKEYEAPKNQLEIAPISEASESSETPKSEAQ
jgi:hypothetical protein